MTKDKAKVRQLLDAVRAAGRDSLTAPEGKQICDAYGIAVPGEGVATSAAAAGQLASGMGFPVVMKIVSPDILHKTEAGGVIVGVKSADEAVKAYDTILANAKKYKADAKVDGVQVQQMLKGGQEVIVGAVTDGSFGKLVAFGLGGVLVEVLKDITFRLAPATQERRALDARRHPGGGDAEGRSRRRRRQPRRAREPDRRRSELVSDFPEISEMDLNPVFATKDSAIAADVRIVVDFDQKPRALPPAPRPRSSRR